jgi:hypothetical protein
MKIKTANIRIFKSVDGQNHLQEVHVKKFFSFNDELFFIHKSFIGNGWSITHYKTGLSVGVKNERTVAAAELKFNKVMEIKKQELQNAVRSGLATYGAAN